VLTNNKPPLQINNVTIKVHHKRPKNTNHTNQLIPAQHPIVKNVTPNKIATNHKPNQPLNPTATIKQLNKTLSATHTAHKTLIKYLINNIKHTTSQHPT